MLLDDLLERVRRGVMIADTFRKTGILGSLRLGGVASFVRDQLGQKRNPTYVLRLHAFNQPDKPALIDGQTRLTYAQLEERVNRAATALAALGVRPGDRVAIMMRNRHEYIEAQWASTRLGAVAVQVGYRLKPAEVAYILSHSKPSAFFFEEALAETAEAAAKEAGVPAPDRLFRTGDAFEAFLAKGDPRVRPKREMRPVAPGDDEEQGGVMIYTSGTTGKPKGAERSFKQSLHEPVVDFIRQVGFRTDDRQLVVCPLYHSAAPVFAALGFTTGSTIVLEDHFEPERVLATMQREKITGAFMVPTMLGRLATVPAEIRRKYDTSSLRWLMSGAAPLPTETARLVEEAFGKILYNFYGATETGMVTLAGPGEHTAKPGTIGRVLSGNELRLLDEHGQDVPVGSVGELWARSTMLVTGYHGDQESTSKAMREGFFSVGDLAYRDADGFYFLADRKFDMVISGGVNIYPLEIEQRIHAHPAVLEAAVIGVPDADWGEALKAFVVRRPGAEVNGDELRAFCKETLANYKVPKQVEFLDALPRNPTGKVLKRELRGRQG